MKDSNAVVLKQSLSYCSLEAKRAFKSCGVPIALPSFLDTEFTHLPNIYLCEEQFFVPLFTLRLFYQTDPVFISSNHAI